MYAGAADGALEKRIEARLDLLWQFNNNDGSNFTAFAEPLNDACLALFIQQARLSSFWILHLTHNQHQSHLGLSSAMEGDETAGSAAPTPHRSRPHSRPPSSRTSSHRKSLSTSALSTLADGAQHTPAQRKRKPSALPVVDESRSVTTQEKDKPANKPRESTIEGAQDALRDVCAGTPVCRTR